MWSMSTPSASTVTQPTGINHIRLTVTDIAVSKAFYSRVFGVSPSMDFSDQAGDPAVRQDPERLYGGCTFTFGTQILGLRPVAEAGDRFDSTRVGLDHVSLSVDSVDALEEAAKRLSDAGITHGEVTRLSFGLAILSIQDPDDINLELAAPLPEGQNASE